MKIAFNPSTVAALIAPPNNKDITFDLRGHNIFARGVKFCGTDTNTWRDIKINNVSIDSNILDLRDGDNTTLTNINGVVTINSTWRPVVDNLTSDSTTSSLSANLGRVLKALIDGKSDSGHNHDDRYVKKSGDTMLGALNFANGTWNLVGDDSYMGDCNISGHFGIKAANTTYPGIAFFNNANDHLGNLTAYNGNIKYGAYSLQFLDNGNTSVSAGTWMNPFSTYNASAVADGQAICVWGQSSYLSNLAADSGDMSLWLKRVNANVATLNMVLDGEYYANGNLRLAHVSEIPNSLKNPHALTISLNGTSQGPYDGSAAKSINITPSSIGAATSDHNHDGRYVYNYGETQMDGASINKNALGMATNSGITEDWWHILQAAWNGEYRWNSLIAFPTLNRNGMYYRSGLDDNTTWGAWVKLLDTNNYSSILDSRYYTESEVNSLLSNYYPITGGNMSGDNRWIGSTMGGGSDYWRIGGSGSDDTGTCIITIGDNYNDKFAVEIADWQGSIYRPLEVIYAGINTLNIYVGGTYRLLYSNSANGSVIHSILNYSSSPYGLLTRIYNTGVVSLQSLRESNNGELFGLSLLPLGGNVGIGTIEPSYKLTVNGVGGNCVPIQLVNASRDGDWVCNVAFFAPNLTNNHNNVITIGKNYGFRNAFGLTHMHIGDGSSSNYAALEVWGGGNVLRWYYDRHSAFLHRADFSSLGSDASYMNSALLIREHGYNGAQADTWANAPRMSWHWSGRVQTQIGLGSNNELYLSKNNFDNAYKLVYETGTWGINISGNAASATKSEYSRSLLGRSTSGNDYDTNSANLVFAEWNTMSDNRWYLKATGYECRVAYANNAGDASRVYGYVGDTGSHELVRCDMNNDQFRIIAGSSGNNNGWAEIATADDGTEPIYVRQYTGVFSSVVRTLTLLDANGYTHFPSYINIGGNENNNSSPDRVWGSNGSDSYLRSYRTSALRVAYADSAGNADTLDGYHATTGRTFNGNINWSDNWDDVWSDGTHTHPWYGFDHRYPNTGAYSTTISDYFGMTIKTANTLRLDFGTLLLNGTDITNINIASATKLQTPRSIWGQSFDGTRDVNGTIYINNSDSSNGAIRLNNDVNSNARISAISDQVIFNTGNAIRFGETSWDWNQWAGLKYTHSNKTIYLGIAENSAFNANSTQSNGTLRLAGITTVTPDSGARIGGSGGDLYLGNADNSSWLKVQNMCSQESSSNWVIKQNGEAYFDKTLEARGIMYTKPYSNSLGINFLNWDGSIAANVTNMFNGIPYDNISIEYSRDNGASWATYTSDPSYRFNLVNDNTPKTDFMLGNASTDNRNQLKQNQLRVTIKIPNEIYQELSWISVEVNKDVFIKCQVYLGDSNGNYSESTNKIIKGNSHLCDICVGPLNIKVGNNTHRYVRLVFSHSSITLLRNGIVSKIRGLALTKYKKPGDRYNISTTGHIYDYDYNMAVTFPNNITTHGLVRANGFYHSSVNSNDYMLLAGGGYSQGVPVRYWAIYYIYIGNSSADVICTKRSGNYNFITSEVWESKGLARFDISFPSGYNKNNTLIFGNGDHRIASEWGRSVYVTITTSTDFNTASEIRVMISGDKDLNPGYANIYFMCMG